MQIVTKELTKEYYYLRDYRLPANETPNQVTSMECCAMNTDH